MKKPLLFCLSAFLLQFSGFGQCPTITCPQNITVNNDPGSCGATVVYNTPVGIDNCGGGPPISQSFAYTGTIDTFIVPAGITSVHIEANGAQGGTGGGLGARMTGDFTVTPNDTLLIVVGQEGFAQVGGNSQNSSGGGGGTFVYTTSGLLVAAGGGGGKCNWVSSQPLHSDANGQVGTSGGASSDGNPGGTAGNGGPAGLWVGVPCAGGGTGWLTPGGGPYGGLNASSWAGGPGYCGGGGGGCGGVGGYGGGGGGGNHYGGGGGGGGYSGGGGGTDPTHGGGGGSYSIGTNQNNIAGINPGNGSVTITTNGSVPVTTQIAGLPSGSLFPIGTTTCWYKVVSGGAADSCSFTVTVTDTEAPSFFNCPAVLNLDATLANCSAAGTWTPPVVSDNCPNPVVTSNYNPGDIFPAGTTVVTYTATDAGGLTNTCSFTVTVASDLSATATMTPQSVGNNGSINLSPTGTHAPFTFLWSNGATTEDISGLVAGNYSVTITDALGCSYADTFMVASTVDVLPEDHSGVSVYPNPSNGFITVEVLSGFTTGKQIRIYNTLGEVVYANSMQSDKMTYDISMLPKGYYTLEISAPGKTSRQALILQ